MVKSILLFILLISGISLSAQNYPEIILPFSSKTVETGVDTLWILKDSQLRKAMISAEKLTIEEQISAELKKKVSLLEDKNKVKDSLVVDLTKDRDFYIKNWNTCKGDVDLFLKKIERQKLFLRLSLGGIAVAFIAGLLLGN